MGVLQLTTATSGTVTANDTGQDVDLIHDAGVTVSLTIAFPANPINGQIFTIGSQGGITTLNLTATIGTIINALTGMAAGSRGRYQYVSSTTKWYKM